MPILPKKVVIYTHTLKPYWQSECKKFTVYNANCIDVLPLLHADAIVTDPPYGIDFKYNSHDDNRQSWFTMMDIVVPLMRIAAKFVIMPCCGIDRMEWWYVQHKPDWLVCWYKGSPGHRSHVGFNDWEAHIVWGKPPRQMHDYFQTRCGFDVEGHPCPKPTEWSDWLVARAALENSVVLDPFMGSGTTAITCLNLNRQFIGIEKDTKYCDVAIARLRRLMIDKHIITVNHMKAVDISRR